MERRKRFSQKIILLLILGAAFFSENVTAEEENFTYEEEREIFAQEQHFLEKKAVWTDSANYQAVLEIQAGGWSPEEKCALTEMLSSYWKVDSVQKADAIQVADYAERSGTLLEYLEIEIGEEEQYAGYLQIEIPILLREEYRNEKDEKRYPVCAEGTGEITGLLWEGESGGVQCLTAESPALLVSRSEQTEDEQKMEKKEPESEQTMKEIETPAVEKMTESETYEKLEKIPQEQERTIVYSLIFMGFGVLFLIYCIVFSKKRKR